MEMIRKERRETEVKKDDWGKGGRVAVCLDTSPKDEEKGLDRYLVGDHTSRRTTEEVHLTGPASVRVSTVRSVTTEDEG